MQKIYSLTKEKICQFLKICEACPHFCDILYVLVRFMKLLKQSTLWRSVAIFSWVSQKILKNSSTTGSYLKPETSRLVNHTCYPLETSRTLISNTLSQVIMGGTLVIPHGSLTWFSRRNGGGRLLQKHANVVQTVSYSRKWGHVLIRTWAIKTVNTVYVTYLDLSRSVCTINFIYQHLYTNFTLINVKFIEFWLMLKY